MDYNKNHPDCRVVRDYILYNTSENPDAGTKRLAVDIVTGLYRPDIVIGEYGGDLLSVLVRDGIYTDLDPYLEKDDFRLCGRGRIGGGLREEDPVESLHLAGGERMKGKGEWGEGERLRQKGLTGIKD